MDASLGRPRDVVVSPDGRHVYLAAVTDSESSIIVFARDSETGSLTRASCVADAGSCALVRALVDVSGLAISPDGATLYAASGFGLAVLSRHAVTGALTQAAGGAGCATDDGAGPCLDARALDGATDVAVSPDGEHVHATSDGSNGVAAFVRTASGALEQSDGAAGCIRQAGGEGCGSARALGGEPISLAVSPDGRTVYAGATEDGGTMIGGGLAVLARDAASGALAQLAGAAGCVAWSDAEGCRPSSNPEVRAMAVDPLSANLYVRAAGLELGMATHAFQALARGADGAVSALAAPSAARAPTPGTSAPG